jgi:predicted nucleic acid-binding protein
MPGGPEKVFIDTNVLIYATLSNDSRFQRAREILLRKNEVSQQLFISVQNLGEMYPNLTGSKMGIPDTPEQARQKIESIASLPRLTVLPLTGDVVTLALEFCEKYGRLKQDYFDMQIVGFMKRYGIGLIYTENIGDFSGIEEITAVNPFSD